MANLIFDIGNTFIKVAVFDRDELVWADHFLDFDRTYLVQLIERHKVDQAIICTVKKDEAAWQIALREHVRFQYFNAAMAAGVRNHYKTPETLGLDRIAAVNGAIKLFKGMPSLVIDAGTCITYDFVDQLANYFGGSISPGLYMRYKALNYYTSGLPLLVADEDFQQSFGDNTDNAIKSGIQNGIKYELTGFIESYYKTYANLNIILTGGDSIFFDTLLKNSIFAPCIKIEPYLVLKGLNAAIQRDND
jgi:type III pantothenate kinase